MKCTCGSELPEDYKFCGRCGRAAQRLLHCEKCGYENPEGNRFCGKCGLRLLAGITASPHAAASSPAPEDQSATEKIDVATLGAANSIVQPRTPSKEVKPASPETPHKEPEAQATHDSLAEEVYEAESATPQAQARDNFARGRASAVGYHNASSVLGLAEGTSNGGSEDGDSYYLLDDQPQRSASVRAWLLLFLLVGATALGWLEWRSTNAQSLNMHSLANLLSPANGSGDGSGQNATAPPLPSPSPSTYDTSSPQTSAEQSGSGSNAPVTQALNKPESDEAAEKLSETDIDDHGKVQQSKPSASVVGEPGNSQPAKHSTAAHDSQNLSAADPLFEKAESYLRVHNCAQGLVYLRTAADKPDPRAQVRLGALYMTGNCVAKDRVTSYQWFTRALSLEPNNQWVLQSRSIVWQQMTPGEKRQVE